MFVELLILVITTVVAYCFYIYKKIHYDFDAKGIKYIPGYPVFGNTIGSLFLKRHAIEDFDIVYKKFPGEKYVGFLDGPSKAILVRDPEIVKAVTVKNFDIFVNRKQLIPSENDPLFGGSLFMMQGDKWRDMRTTLSPAFTGSKMRNMMPFMMETSDNIINYLKDHTSEVLEASNVMRRYTLDIIATTAFGLKVDSLKDPENEFFVMGQNLFNFSVGQRIKFVLAMVFPGLFKMLGIDLLFSKDVQKFFKKVLNDTIEYRAKNNVRRPDMIQLIIEASENKLKHEESTADDDLGHATVQEMLKPREHTRKWTLDELTAQVFLFFGAGFETSASTINLCIHELALSPESQEKLYEEIREHRKKHGELTFTNIPELKYLDAVLNETMRRTSAAIVMDRVCLQEFELPPTREGAQPYILKPGDSVYAPVNSIQNDPENYSEPEKFIPERFLGDNIHKIKPFTFTPFGSGPRNCIGSRFALLQMKVMLYNLILHFKIVRCEKTLDPIKLKPADFNLHVLGGTHVIFENRI